ncbi:hypothetical protein BDZ89DRAFT_943616 [Hymenopellis radicata]|nr:hypothetical protein BDZ89DRAFT_943616 [Hymenopellis radicata]
MARAIYIKTVAGGCLMIIMVMLSVFSIYWGSLWTLPAHNIQGWIVDFDGSSVGSAVTSGLASSAGKVTWTEISASTFPNGLLDVEHQLRENKVWTAIVVHANATTRLQSATQAVDVSYNGSQAISFYAVEARNENAFRSIIRPSSEAALIRISQQFAISYIQSIASDALSDLARSAPHILTAPIGYTTMNLIPFDVPVAAAMTGVGLIFLTIVTFFFAMIGNGARVASGFQNTLTTRSLITLRIVSIAVAYFVLSLFYSLLNRAFQVDFSRKFGHSGFLVFWMLSYVGMLAIGLALEAMFTILTIRFIPFFLITWIIVNVSVCLMPIEVLPRIYHYGYGSPFYHISTAVRTILFGTKNEIGFHFGILIIWVGISLVTLPLFQWLQRRPTASRKQILRFRIHLHYSCKFIMNPEPIDIILSYSTFHLKLTPVTTQTREQLVRGPCIQIGRFGISVLSRTKSFVLWALLCRSADVTHSQAIA